jgi:hypothetical protein
MGLEMLDVAELSDAVAALITAWLEVRVLPGPPFSFCAPLISTV